MLRYIDADEAKEILIKWLDVTGALPKATSYYHECLSCIDDTPTADVVEVKHGEWVHTDKAKHWKGKDECGVCTYHTHDREDLSHLNYCPNCGAKMDGGKTDG